MAAAALGSRILRQAADAYDRAARAPYGRIPPPSPAGNQLRQAARLLSAFVYLTGDRSLTPIVLITRLAALAEAVAELRDSQQRAAQAAAARAAAEHLYAAARSAPDPPPHQAPHASAAAQLAALSFPQPTIPGRPPPLSGHSGLGSFPADDRGAFAAELLGQCLLGVTQRLAALDQPQPLERHALSFLAYAQDNRPTAF
jgi:hypothetical protein